MQLKLPFWNKSSQSASNKNSASNQQDTAQTAKQNPKYPPKQSPKSNQGLGSVKIGSWVIDGNDLLAGRSYWFMLVFLTVLILMMGVWTNEQIQERHQIYRELSSEIQAYQKMQIEAQRLIIEQQTFGATPTVAGRAVGELNMFYPTDKHRLIITEPSQ